MSEQQDLEPMDNTQHDAQTDDERVITIGWQSLIMPILAVAVVGGGWFLGRWIGGQNVEATPVTSNAPAPQVVNAAGGAPVEISLSDPSSSIQIVPEPAGLDTLPDDQVIALPERFHPMVGKQAPDFTMTQLDTGEEVSISDYLGRPILINYWATWCPPCRREMPFLQAMHDKYAEQGFAVLAVDAGEKVPPSMMLDTINRYINSAGLTFPVLYGDNTYDVQREWTVLGLPGSFMIDAQGMVTAYHSGMYPNTATLEDHMMRTLPSLAAAAGVDVAGSDEG